MPSHAAELRELVPGADWEGSTALGMPLALVILAAFPVFLPSWFSRPVIKAQWRAGLDRAFARRGLRFVPRRIAY